MRGLVQTPGWLPPGDGLGENSALRPAGAPSWLRPALRVDPDYPKRALGQRAASRSLGHSPTVRKPAAVLVAISGDSAGTAEILLIHRSPTMRSHSGQIAFPGGRIDPGDSNAVDAALREAWEETGLDRHCVRPLQQWEQLHIGVTGNPVSPVLAHWHTPCPVGVVSPSEADDVFVVPLNYLADPDNRFNVQYGQWTGPAFHIEDYVLWGFTGAIVATLIEHGPWHRPWDSQDIRGLAETLAASRNEESGL